MNGFNEGEKDYPVKEQSRVMASRKKVNSLSFGAIFPLSRITCRPYPRDYEKCILGSFKCCQNLNFSEQPARKRNAKSNFDKESEGELLCAVNDTMNALLAHLDYAGKIGEFFISQKVK